VNERHAARRSADWHSVDWVRVRSKGKALTTEGTGSHGVSQNTHRGTGVHRFHHPGHEDAEGLARESSVIFGNTKTARGK
jgi:hypothetical protein